MEEMFTSVFDIILQQDKSLEKFLNGYDRILSPFSLIGGVKSWQCSSFPYHLLTLSIMVVLYLYSLKEAIPAAFGIAPRYRFGSPVIENSNIDHSKTFFSDKNNTNKNAKENLSHFRKIKLWLRLTLTKIYLRIKNFRVSRKQVSSLLHLSCGLIILIVPFLIYLVDGTQVGYWKSISLQEYKSKFEGSCLPSINSHKDIILTLQSVDSCAFLMSKNMDQNNENYIKILNYQSEEDIQKGIIDDTLYTYHYQYKTPMWLYLAILALSLMSILSGLHLIFLRVPAYDIASIRGYAVAISSGLSYVSLGALFRLRVYSIYYPVACVMAIYSIYSFIFAWSDAFHHTLFFLQRKYLLHRIYPYFGYYHSQEKVPSNERKRYDDKNILHENQSEKGEEVEEEGKEGNTIREEKRIQSEKNISAQQIKVFEVEQLERRYFGKGKFNQDNVPSQHTLYSILVSSLYEPPSLKAFRYTHAPSNLVTVIPVVCIALFSCLTLIQIRLVFFSSDGLISSISYRLMNWVMLFLEENYPSSTSTLLSLINSSYKYVSSEEIIKLAYLLPWCCNNGLLATLASTYATLIGSLVLHGKVSQRKGALLSLFMAMLPLLNIVYLYQLIIYNNKQFSFCESSIKTCQEDQIDCEMDEILNYMNTKRHGLKDLLNLLVFASP